MFAGQYVGNVGQRDQPRMRFGVACRDEPVGYAPEFGEFVRQFLQCGVGAGIRVHVGVVAGPAILFPEEAECLRRANSALYGYEWWVLCGVHVVAEVLVLLSVLEFFAGQSPCFR